MGKTMSEIGKVFSFTTKTTAQSKGWKNTTIILAVILLLLPVIILSLGAVFDDGEPENLVYSGGINKVYVSDSTTGECDYSVLTAGNDDLASITYEKCATFDEAKAKTEENPGSVALNITMDDGSFNMGQPGFRCTVITPDETEISEDDIEILRTCIYNNFTMLTVQKSGLTAEELAIISTPVTTDELSPEELNIPEESGESELDDHNDSAAKEVIGMVIPYVTVMFMYFFVLFYGQSTARLVVMEKTSKLMDTILVSVQPQSLIFGKTLSGVFCALIQLAFWIASLLAGFYVGGMCASAITGNDSLNILKQISDSGFLDGMFTPASIVLALLIVISGCVLYCACASIGGALAGKQEDLQSTNVLFTMALVVSFLVTIFGGSSGSGMISDSAVLNYIPFTAVLVSPARVLIGQLSTVGGIISLLITLAVSAAIMFVSGKIYKSMSFYRGNAPKPNQILKILSGK